MNEKYNDEERNDRRSENSRSNFKSGKAKGGRRKNRGQKNKTDSRAYEGKTRARNDVSWYGANSVLTSDAANLAYAQSLGLPITLSSAGANALTPQVFPGLMTFSMVTTPGECGTWNSPVNVAIRNMYSFIRHANSGSKNYDAANLGMYLQAYDSAATYYAWMVRLYGLARTVMPRNRYTPETFFAAENVDYYDVVTNLNQLRAYINTYAARLFALKVPSKWHVIERHMWLFTNVFKDGESDKAQMYMFIPTGFWRYQLGTTPETTGLFHHTVVERDDSDVFRPITVSDIMKFGDEMLNSILNDEDFNIMSGDIIKAYGDSVFNLALISPEYSVVPTFEPEVLLQIHNMSLFYLSEQATVYDIDMDDILKQWKVTEDLSESANVGAILFHNEFDMSIVGSMTNRANKANLANLYAKVIDMPISNPTPILNILATRLQVVPGMKTTASEVHTMFFTSYGTEFCVKAMVWNKTPSGFAAHLVCSNNFDSAGVYYEGPEAFDFRPIRFEMGTLNLPIGTYDLNGDDTDIVVKTNVAVYGPIANYAIVSHETIQQMHLAALMGMYELTK